jgi:hypothetical protein
VEVVEDGELREDAGELLVDRVLGELDLSHVEVSDSRDLEAAQRAQDEGKGTLAQAVSLSLSRWEGREGRGPYFLWLLVERRWKNDENA